MEEHIPEIWVVLNLSVANLQEVILPSTEDLLGDDRVQDCIYVLRKILQQQWASLLNALQNLPVKPNTEQLRRLAPSRRCVAGQRTCLFFLALNGQLNAFPHGRLSMICLTAGKSQKKVTDNYISVTQ